MRTRIPFTIGLAGLLVADAAAAVEVTRGPVLSQPTRDGVTIVFEFDEVAAPTIRWGAEGALDAGWTSDIEGDDFEVTLTGLPAGAWVDYAIFVGEERITEVARIPTEVGPDDPFRFVVFGDTRSRHDVHARIVEQMAEVEEVRFYVQTGDLVSNGEDFDEWVTYFEIELPMTVKAPIFPTLGNHDEHDGDASLYTAMFANPTNSPQPELFYSYDYANVHLLMVDGHVNAMTWLECFPVRGLLLDDCYTEEQIEWMLADLEAAAQNPDIDHILVFTHVGPYSSKPGRSGSAQMRMLLPEFQRLGVTAIFSGHDHFYERGISGNGIPYAVTGGGGAPLYDIADPSAAPHEVVVARAVEHWMEVDVDGPIMRVRTIAIDGEEIDAFTIDATPECAADADCAGAVPDIPCEGHTATCSIGGRCVSECPSEAGDDAGGGDEVGIDAGIEDGGDDGDAGAHADAGEVDAADADGDVPDAGAGIDSGPGEGVDTPEAGGGVGSPGSRASGGRRGCAVGAPVGSVPWLLAAIGVACGARRRRSR